MHYQEVFNDLCLQTSAAVLAAHQLHSVSGVQAPPPPGLGGPMPPGFGHMGSPSHIRPPTNVTVDEVTRLQHELIDKRQMMVKWEEGMKQAATVTISNYGRLIT